MITKERLKELIKQGATIYTWSDRKELMELQGIEIPFEEQVFEIKLHKTDRVSNIGEVNILDSEEHTIGATMYGTPINLLFETKWEMEFGNITRTETLKLPTWEEFNKDNLGIKFYNKSREFYLHRVRYSSSDKNPLWKIDLYESYGDDEDTVAWKKSWDLTKENYIEACKLCLRLFKGEEA